jgi:hypothetical protein
MPALPAAARAISTAVTDGVAAAGAQDAAAFDEATTRLAALDPALVSVVLGAVVRSLLEEAHPAGLTGDELRTVLEDRIGSAGWASELDPVALVIVLTGALGLQDPDEEPSIHPRSVGRHAMLLVDRLLSPTGHPLAAHLDAALAELARAQTIEMP